MVTGGHWWSTRGLSWLLVVIRGHWWSLFDKIDEESKKIENACFAAFFRKVLFCSKFKQVYGIFVNYIKSLKAINQELTLKQPRTAVRCKN